MIPDYSGQGFELSGLVFFQSFNDAIIPECAREYETNLANLIKDLRVDLGVPDMPFVIGETGMQSGRGFTAVQKAQEAVGNNKALGKGAFVKTSPFVERGRHGDGGYHYSGNARTFYRMGEAFGKAMIGPIGDSPAVDHSGQVKKAYEGFVDKYGDFKLPHWRD